MLIATAPYVGKRLHLDPDPEPDPDPKLNYGYGSEHANNFGSGSTTLHISIFLIDLVENVHKYLFWSTHHKWKYFLVRALSR